MDNKEKKMLEEIDERFQFIIQHIRKNSEAGQFTTYVDFLEEPISLEEKEVEEVIKTLKTSEEFKDFKELKSKKNTYYYSSSKMTDNYARMLLRLEENDLLELAAETIRYDSKKYPRTTDIATFFSYPFGFNSEEFKNMMEQLNSKDEYKDIKESRASNGVVRLFSDLYLTQDYADALTELIEVSMDE